MQKLERYEDVKYALQSNEIIVCFDKKKTTYFALMQSGMIRMSGEHINAKITQEAFEKLYFNTTFYVYENNKKEVFINEEKDEEYYRLWHK